MNPFGTAILAWPTFVHGKLLSMTRLTTIKNSIVNFSSFEFPANPSFETKDTYKNNAPAT